MVSLMEQDYKDLGGGGWNVISLYTGRIYINNNHQKKLLFFYRDCIFFKCLISQTQNCVFFSKRMSLVGTRSIYIQLLLIRRYILPQYYVKHEKKLYYYHFY
jgi:hypothetical protein